MGKEAAIVVLVLAALLSAGCTMPQAKTCPSSCDDANACTRDFCGKETDYACAHSADPKKSPCCGNGDCEDSEFCGSCPADCSICPDVVVESFDDAYERFMKSVSLDEDWQPECTLKLNDPENTLLIAKISRTTEGYLVSCRKGAAYDPYDAPKIDSRWWQCKETPSSVSGLAEAAYGSIHGVQEEAVYLDEPVREDSGVVSYALIQLCAYRDNKTKMCHNAVTGMPEYCKYKDVAYAALDANTGKVYW